MDFIKLLSTPDGMTLALVALSIGVMIHSIVAYVLRPSDVKKMKKDLNDYRQTNLNLVEENMYHRSQTERLRLINQSFMKDKRIADETIFTLNQEKQTLQNCLDEAAEKIGKSFIECDSLKAKLNRMNSPAYSKSDKMVNKEGKIN